jgi:PhnB protein
MRPSWIPSGFHAITPNIVVDNADTAVEFLTSAFGFHEIYRLTTSSGKVAHCELQLGDSILNVGEAMDGFPRATLLAQIYVEDSDAIFQRAVEAGAKILMPMTDMFFGSREGRVEDPFGNIWTIATLKEDVTPAEMQRRMEAAGY